MSIPVPAATAHALNAAIEGRSVDFKVPLLARISAAQRLLDHVSSILNRPDLVIALNPEQHEGLKDTRDFLASVVAAGTVAPRVRRLR